MKIKRAAIIACSSLLTLAASARAQLIYSGNDQTSSTSSAVFSSSYGNLGSTSNTTVTYQANIDPTYTNVELSNFVLTSSPQTVTETASFANGVGQPLLPVTTTFTYSMTLNDTGYTQGTTIYPGVGGYRMAGVDGNLYNGTITYSGTYSISGGGQTTNGSFNDTFGTSAWSNFPYSFNGTVSNPNPLVTFTGSGPVYGLSLSEVNYDFYTGDLFSSALFSGTVDGVNISVTPSSYAFESIGSSSTLQIESAPEPHLTWLGACAIALLIFMRARQRRAKLGHAISAATF